MVKTIQLDCSPGLPRPGSFINYVIKGTGLEERETVSRTFGNWTWDYNDVPDETWKEIKATLKRRIEYLCEEGIIRYGSW